MRDITEEIQAYEQHYKRLAADLEDTVNQISTLYARKSNLLKKVTATKDAIEALKQVQEAFGVLDEHE
jgi:peptidoglycan hydrolase CwlO-like protein